MEIGFTPRDNNFTKTADEFRLSFYNLLRESINLSDGVIGPNFFDSGEVITPYTLKAEEASVFYTSVPINTELTKMEGSLSESIPNDLNPMLVQRVYTLDPTENELILAANNFGNEFNQLYEESKEAMDQTLPLSIVTNESLKATMETRNFNAQGTEGILDCKVKSIIISLLGDHVQRESNHYLRLLLTYAK